MKQCFKCKNDADYQFHTLEIQTLPVRDLKGEHKVQAIGSFSDFAVCQTCAKAYLEKITDFKKSGLKSCILFGLLVVAGIAVTILCWHGEGVFRLLGLAGIAGGSMGLYGTAKSSSDKRKEYAGLSQKQALEEAAWEVVVSGAPQKSEDSDLTYIPVTSKTLAMKKGDLMVQYDLLPEIAVKTYEMIHKKA